MAPRMSGHSWLHDGPQTVAPGLHRIPLPLPDDGLRAVNSYAIEDDGGLVLVDPGQYGPDTSTALATGLATLGLRLEDVVLCIATHVHRDHYSNAVALREQFGIPVYLGRNEQSSLRLLTSPRFGPIHTQLNLLPRCGAGVLVDRLTQPLDGREPPARLWQEPDQWLADGDLLQFASRSLRVLETPGHTFGHIVLEDTASGLLLTGDHLLPHITPSIGFEPHSSVLPLADYLDSLRMLLARPDARLVPAHGPIADSVHERAGELLDHHDTRLAATLDQVRHGAHDPFAVAQQLRWTRHGRRLGDLDAYNSMLAVIETKAHLDVLAVRNELDRDDDGDVITYRLPNH